MCELLSCQNILPCTDNSTCKLCQLRLSENSSSKCKPEWINSNFLTSKAFQKSLSFAKASNLLTWISQFQGQTQWQTTFVRDEWSPFWLYWLSDWCLRYILPISPRWHIRSCCMFLPARLVEKLLRAKTIQRGKRLRLVGVSNCAHLRRCVFRRFRMGRWNRLRRRFLPRWRWGHVGARNLLVGTEGGGARWPRWWPPGNQWSEKLSSSSILKGWASLPGPGSRWTLV